MRTPQIADAYVSWRRKRPAGRPYNFSEIVDHLYLGGWPRGEDAPLLVQDGIRLIISMFWGIHPSALNEPPLRLVQYATIDSPFTPIPIAILKRGVAEAMPVMKRGEGVLVHCHFGRHRSVALICSILISMGYTSEAAMKLVKERHPMADPDLYYIRGRIEKFERSWQQDHPKIIE
jgi:hypothetical protein